MHLVGVSKASVFARRGRVRVRGWSEQGQRFVANALPVTESKGSFLPLFSRGQGQRFSEAVCVRDAPSESGFLRDRVEFVCHLTKLAAEDVASASDLARDTPAPCRTLILTRSSRQRGEWIGMMSPRVCGALVSV